MQKPGQHAAEPAARRKPSAEEVRRDPFATRSAVVVPGFQPEVAEVIVAGVDEQQAMVGATTRAKMSPKTRYMILGGCVGLLLIGFVVGSLVAGRVEKAMMVRDARIAQIEIEKLGNTFAAVDQAITTASQEAQQNKFSKEHMKVLAEKLQGNPFNPTLFTDRSYKGFDDATVDALNTYYDQWGELYTALGSHFRKTENDEPELAASDAEFAKGDPTQFGVVFARDEDTNTILANLVVLGKKATADGQTSTRIQSDVGLYSGPEDGKRTVYAGKEGDEEFSKAPDGFVIPVASDDALLKDGVKPHFAQYQARLKEMAALVASMREAQKNLSTAINKIAAESAPSLLTGINVDDAVEEYRKAALAAAAGLAEQAEAAKAE